MSEMSKATKARYDKPQPYRGVLARFPRAILEIAKVSVYGDKKHERPFGDVDFLDIPEAEVSFVEAEVRHLLKEAIHGPINREDGDLLHKAQKAWEALADLEVYLYQRDMPRVEVSRDTIKTQRYETTGPEEEASLNTKPGRPHEHIWSCDSPATPNEAKAKMEWPDGLPA